MAIWTPEAITAYRESLGGRRFMLTLGCGVVSTVLLWVGKIDQTMFFQLIASTVGPYIAAGTYQKVKEAQNVPPAGVPPA